MSELIETREERLFLQLTIARSHNKELLMEIGMLQSEKDELRHEISKLKAVIKSQEKRKDLAEKMSKHDLYYKGVKETISKLISKVSVGSSIGVLELKELIDNSFKKWSPLKRKNDIQQQESLLRKEKNKLIIESK